MLYESDIVDAVCAYLIQSSFVIKQKRAGYEQGDDIIAEKHSPEFVAVYVEVKGETSSDERTKRYGLRFTRNQVRNHVSRAFFKAATTISRTDLPDNTVVAMAFPDNHDHRDFVQDIAQAIDRLGLVVFWVTADKVVTVEPQGAI